MKIFKRPSDKRESRKPQKLADEQDSINQEPNATKRAVKLPRSRILKTQAQYDELNKWLEKLQSFNDNEDNKKKEEKMLSISATTKQSTERKF